MSHPQPPTATQPTAAQPAQPKALTAADKILTGIAVAGDWRVPDSESWRIANPGLLTIDYTHKGVGKDGPYIVYAVTDDGGAALQSFVSQMMGGSLPDFPPTLSVTEFATKFAHSNPDKWVAAFDKETGANPDTKLQQIT